MTSLAQSGLAYIFQRDRRPLTLLAVVLAGIAVFDGGHGYFFTRATLFSILQLFATYGFVSLAVGLSLLVREFDLSVAGSAGLAGVLAVLTGATSAPLGAMVGIAAGTIAGFAQGLCITRLKIGSVAVTLGGLLTMQGLTYVLTGNQSLSYPGMDLALQLNQPILGIFSARALIALAAFLIIAVFMGCTRFGRDVLAVGGDRRASHTAGVPVESVVVIVFTISGFLSALGGVLLSFGLAAASPAPLSDVLAPAAAGAIIGGVSLVGGRGRPLGIAAGVLVICVLRSGLNAAGASPDTHEIVTGLVLFVIALLDAPYLKRRYLEALLPWRERRARAYTTPHGE